MPMAFVLSLVQKKDIPSGTSSAEQTVVMCSVPRQQETGLLLCC